MCIVVKSGYCSGLRHGVGVERLANFLQRGDEIGMSDAIADTQSGQAVDFREGAHQEQVWLFVGAHQRQQVDRLVEELVIRLVHYQQHVVWDLLDEGADVPWLGQGAGGIIRVSHPDNARRRRDRLEHCGQIVPMLDRGNGVDLGSHYHRDKRVNGEAVLRHDYLVAGTKQHVRHELDDLVGAVTEDEVPRLDVQFGRQFILQVKRIAIRVKVALANSGFHRLDGEWAGAKRILVRSDLDNLVTLKAELACDLLDRAARLVHWQGVQRGV